MSTIKIVEAGGLVDVEIDGVQLKCVKSLNVTRTVGSTTVVTLNLIADELIVVSDNADVKTHYVDVTALDGSYRKVRQFYNNECVRRLPYTTP